MTTTETLFEYSNEPSATDKRLARAVEEKYHDNRYGWRVVDNDTAWTLLGEGEDLICCSPESDVSEVKDLAAALNVAAIWVKDDGPYFPNFMSWAAGGLIERYAWDIVDYGLEDCTCGDCDYCYHCY